MFKTPKSLILILMTNHKFDPMNELYANVQTYLTARVDTVDAREGEELSRVTEDDLRSENAILRQHLLELNEKLIEQESWQRNMVDIEKELALSNELRSSAEQYVGIKNNEIKQLNSLLEEQAGKVKIAEEALQRVNAQLVKANLDILPVVKLRSDIYGLKTQLEDFKKERDDIITDLERTRRQLADAEQVILVKQREGESIKSHFMKISTLNMKLEAEKKCRSTHCHDHNPNNFVSFFLLRSCFLDFSYLFCIV